MDCTDLQSYIKKEISAAFRMIITMMYIIIALNLLFLTSNL